MTARSTPTCWSAIGGSFSRWPSSGAVGRDVPLEALLTLPGVVDDMCGVAADATADWPAIERTLQAALENLARMRCNEGQAMAADLTANCQSVAASLERIEKRAPLVVEDYRSRLFDRLKRTLAELEVTLDAADLIKEVGLFADRSDISEEIVRLRSHLEQFKATMELPESSGRKLDFLTQEMFRETNTIGSKANDVEIAREVIESQDGGGTHPGNDPEHRVTRARSDEGEIGGGLGSVGGGQNVGDAAGVPIVPRAAGAKRLGHDPAAALRRDRRGGLPLRHE